MWGYLESLCASPPPAPSSAMTVPPFPTGATVYLYVAVPCCPAGRHCLYSTATQPLRIFVLPPCVLRQGPLQLTWPRRRGPQLLRHVAEGEEDRMDLSKQIWGYRAGQASQGCTEPLCTQALPLPFTSRPHTTHGAHKYTQSGHALHCWLQGKLTREGSSRTAGSPTMSRARGRPTYNSTVPRPRPSSRCSPV